MRRFLAFGGLVLTLATLACSVGGISLNSVRGSGEVVREERSASGFSGVQVTNQGDVIIELGDSESLVVEAEDNLLEYIKTEVRGDTLVLSTEGATNLNNTEPIRYYVTAKALDAIEITSSGDVSAPGLTADTFTIRVSSSGGLDLGGLEAGLLDLVISSSGSVTIGDGQVNRQEITISSSGSYDGRDLDSSEAQVRLSSSGDATVRVSGSLDANLSSSGNVYYIGDPEVNVSESSSGRAIQQDE